MKGIVLAGGTGSRLFPLTKVTNKHLLPVGQAPMIYYPIRKILETGIKEILVVTGLEHMGAVVNLLGSGREFNCEFTYRVQDEAGGIAQALLLAEQFVGNDSMLVILGDNITTADLTPHREAFSSGAKILLKEVSHPNRFGVPEFNNRQQIVRIEEKPDNPKSNYAVTGMYFYDHRVFDIIKQIKPSARGELEITDVNNSYLDQSALEYGILDGEWTDAGTFESLAVANRMLSDEH